MSSEAPRVAVLAVLVSHLQTENHLQGPRKLCLFSYTSLGSVSSSVDSVAGSCGCGGDWSFPFQETSGPALCFPSGRDVRSARLPRRQTRVPAAFRSPAHYKRLFASCLTGSPVAFLLRDSRSLRHVSSKLRQRDVFRCDIL